MTDLAASQRTADRHGERIVLSLISLGLIGILLAIIAGIFLSRRTLPNWAENVLISIGTASVLKLGDCLAALVTLSTGRQVERLGAELANSSPLDSSPVPRDAKEAADQVAGAATDEAATIAERNAP